MRVITAKHTDTRILGYTDAQQHRYTVTQILTRTRKYTAKNESNCRRLNVRAKVNTKGGPPMEKGGRAVAVGGMWA